VALRQIHFGKHCIRRSGDWRMSVVLISVTPQCHGIKRSSCSIAIASWWMMRLGRMSASIMGMVLRMLVGIAVLWLWRQ
jgi:hypothetical protein